MHSKKGHFDHLTLDEIGARLKANIAKQEALTGRKVKHTAADIAALLEMGKDPDRMRKALNAAADDLGLGSAMLLSSHEIYQKYFLPH